MTALPVRLAHQLDTLPQEQRWLIEGLWSAQADVALAIDQLHHADDLAILVLHLHALPERILTGPEFEGQGFIDLSLLEQVCELGSDELGPRLCPVERELALDVQVER